MKLSIIVPVYNEEKTIDQVLDALVSITLPCEKEIIVVDDGSIDKTAIRIKNYKSRNKEIKVFFHLRNQGKGAAIKTGIKAASGDFILIQDADLEYSPSEIPKLLLPITDNNKSMKIVKKAVYGSRFKNKNVEIPYLYLIGNKFLTLITNLLFGTSLSDMETGYKLLPANFIKNIKLKSKHFNIEPEITAMLIKNKIPIIEIPISYKGRSHLTGKKLTAIDAFEAIRTLIYFRFLNR